MVIAVVVGSVIDCEINNDDDCSCVWCGENNAGRVIEFSFREESAPFRTIVGGELEWGGGSRQDSGVYCSVTCGLGTLIC